MRRSVVAGAGVLLLAAGAAAGVVLAFRGDDKPLTVEEYLDRASATCVTYARKLDAIAPPDPTSAKDVVASVSRALPILEDQADAVRRIRPPKELEPRVNAFFARTDRSLAALDAELAAARRRDLPAMKARFAAWLAASTDAQTASRRVGYRCG